MKKSPLTHYFVTITILLVISAGCARKADDSKITAEIQNKFSEDSGLSSKQITVQTDEGGVTLSGNVDNNEQRDAAGRQAASVRGVKTVVNNLLVGTASDAMVSASALTPAPAATPASSASVKTEKAAPGKKSGKYHDSAYTADPPPSPDSDANVSPSTTADSTQPPAADANPPAAAPTTAPDTTTQPAPAPPPAPKKLVVDQGTQVAARLIDPIDSEKNQVGDTFHATLNAALISDGQTAIPAGVELIGHVVDVKNGSKFAGQSVVILQLDSLSAGGKTYNLQTDQYKKETASRNKSTAEKVGGGALIGGLIGALAGGGKGAAIGAAAGAGVGGGAQAASKSPQIKLPSETVLNFTLQAPISVAPTPSPNADRPKLSNDAQSQPKNDAPPAIPKSDSQPQ